MMYSPKKPYTENFDKKFVEFNEPFIKYSVLFIEIDDAVFLLPMQPNLT